MPSDFIYLASTSPRRQELLAQIGVRFELLLPDPDEDAEALEAFRPGESPTRYVERVTLAKAAAAWERLARRGLPPAPILAADTTVAIGGRILAKPADDADACRMLAELAGRTHRVLTAVAVVRGPRVEHRINVSRVCFARMSAAEIARYVASGEPRGKAGGYAIQGLAGSFVIKLVGSYPNVVGMPLFETATMLSGEGFPIHYNWVRPD